MSDTLVFNDDLPEDLLAAPRAFIAWSRAELLREQAASTPTEPLYHYTDETALRGILQKQAFWCFSHAQQKDPTEFEYALRVAMDVLRRQGASDDFFRHQFAECVIDMLQVNKPSGPFEFYLFSVSRHRNHGPQWQAYGQAGTGYAIGLSPTLFQPDKDDLYEEANKTLHSVAHGLLHDGGPYGDDSVYGCWLIFHLCMLPLFEYRTQLSLPTDERHRPMVGVHGTAAPGKEEKPGRAFGVCCASHQAGIFPLGPLTLPLDTTDSWRRANGRSFRARGVYCWRGPIVGQLFDGTFAERSNRNRAESDPHLRRRYPGEMRDCRLIR
jgi:hypothetical protein